MTRSKTFWTAAAFLSLAAMFFSGYSIYQRVSLHFSGDTIAVQPVPLPPPQAEGTAAQPPESSGTEETKPVVTTKGAQAAEQAETEKIKAVKTAFSYKDPKAKSVKIAGSFTSWKDIKLTKKNGVWETVIYILPGTYPYHFTVDGKKKLDPGKPKAPTGDSLVDVN